MDKLKQLSIDWWCCEFMDRYAGIPHTEGDRIQPTDVFGMTGGVVVLPA